MNSHSKRLLLGWLLLRALLIPGLAEVQMYRVLPAGTHVVLQWLGGHGPFGVEVSSDLRNWSDQGDWSGLQNSTLSAFQNGAYYRVRDLDPDGVAGSFFARLQTEQSEFGPLLGRHRLKSRVVFYLTRDPVHAGGTQTPANFWRTLTVHWQTVEDGRVRTWSGPLETLGTVATPGNDRTMTVSWTRGEGTTLRTFKLSLVFPYPVNVGRATRPNASDPEYQLTCSYASDQPELEWSEAGQRLGSTRQDSVRWIEMAPLGTDWNGVERKYSVSKNGARVDLHFLEGMPLYQGEVPWILKTYPLDRWLSPAVGLGTLPAWSTDSDFSRSLRPGHHNFYEEVLIEPELDPAMSAETRDEFRRRNIRYIHTFKDLAGVTAGGGSAEDIQYISFDGSIRRP